MSSDITPPPTPEGDLISRAAALSFPDRWLAAFGSVEIKHTSAREYAVAAVTDLRDCLASLPASQAQGEEAGRIAGILEAAAHLIAIHRHNPNMCHDAAAANIMALTDLPFSTAHGPAALEAEIAALRADLRAAPAPLSAGVDDVTLGLLGCLRDTCAHLSMEVDALKSGIELFETDGMTSTLSDDPDDAHTVAKIKELEAVIAASVIAIRKAEQHARALRTPPPASADGEVKE